mmetsp:Transcript_32548/g.51979  ORF Transcript_32548/g.51979 Transcript_32548/m.51979 type:complete len:618 (-) Transcript_32548:103-1956(-)
MDSGGSFSLDGLDGLESFDPEKDDILPTFEDLTPFEVEHFVGDLQELKLEEVGSTNWLNQHERIEKLNWTAHSQAKEGLDEFVVDQFNMLEKVQLLIYDLIITEGWKERIWPLVKAKLAKFSSLRSYIPVYHEASVANLLEVCLYHRTSCEEAGDALVDLVDYCVRKLRYLLSVPNSELIRQVTSAKECNEWDDVRVLDEQFYECEFQVCMCVISIIRFLTDHRVAMPLAVTTRLLETHDVLMLLVPLMEKAPWVRKNKLNGRIEKFEDHEWQVVEADDEGRLPKLHTQVWLAIYNLVMDQECRSRYELSSIRRENLLRLRRYINEVVVDQLPPLTNLHRTLEELSISGRFTGADSSSTMASPFVVELVAEVREALVRTYEGRWQEVADQQMKDVFVKETPDELKRLANMISIPKEMFEDPPPPTNGPADQESGSSSLEDSGPTAKASAWEAILALPRVRSTASFFAAAQASQAPPDEVIVLSAPPQSSPRSGEKLLLELRRSRRGQLNSTQAAVQRAVAGAALAAKQGAAGGETFTMAVQAFDNEAPIMRSVPFVSAKGASRTAMQLRQLLEKPGRENDLEMYSNDVAEFAILVASASGEEGIPASQVEALSLAAS